MLAKAFLNRFNEEHGRSIRGFDNDAVLAIEASAWPGPVRDLESRIKRAIIMADGSHITRDDLELSQPEEEPLPFNLKQIREDAERIAIQRALAHSNDNISDTAKLLGITRPTLYTILEKHGLKP